MYCVGRLGSLVVSHQTPLLISHRHSTVFRKGLPDLGLAAGLGKIFL